MFVPQKYLTVWYLFLDDGELQFGKMVSSSNGYDTTRDEIEVQVTTDNKLIWSMSIDEKISI